MKSQNFSVIHRAPGHWDIYIEEDRAFRIRGTPGAFILIAEREQPNPQATFKTVSACMAFVCDAIMFEHITESPLKDGNNILIKP